MMEQMFVNHSYSKHPFGRRVNSNDQVRVHSIEASGPRTQGSPEAPLAFPSPVFGHF